mmetsp:Transcript_1494/g.2203  ORF Transcript_1494/g.2203 Transcript_1494/m.2203 type:complete len:268 (+) Transcript_1494:80-883(+)
MKLYMSIFYCLTRLLSSSSHAAAMTTKACANPKSGPAALIFLHGLGDTPAGWSSLEDMLPSIKPRLKQVKFVFPPSPTIPITINGGATMPGWFDILDWPIGLKARDDPTGKLDSVSKIEQEVSRLESEEGIPKNRIVVGGFSQGGAVALLTAYRSASAKEQSYAGCVSLSGWVTLKDDVIKNLSSSSSKNIPLFWGHGQYDDKVLFEQQAFGVNLLEENGVKVDARSYPVGHSSDPEEMRAMAEFLDDLLYGSCDDDVNDTAAASAK